MESCDNWTLAVGDDNGPPLFVRINEGAAPLIGDKRFGHCVTITTRFAKPTDKGLPSEADFDDLNLIENVIHAAITADNTGICVHVATTEGRRVFTYYTGNPDGVRSAIDEARATTLKGRQIDLVIESDPKWSTYRELLSTMTQR